MMKHLTEITTHDFARLRRIAGLSNRSRIPVCTDEEIELIHELLERVCTDGKPLGKREYLEICNVSNDSQDLGKVAAEVAIRWPESRLKFRAMRVVSTLQFSRYRTKNKKEAQGLLF